jgi:ParB family transcriptional regulator, chromosome partitioning protein
VQLPADRLAAQADNVRASLGDLRELSRSIKAQGIIVPLLVLPADDTGVHLIVGGHRRYAAALAVEVILLPVLVRDLSPTQVLDAMLVENSQRTELTLVESIRAVARYQFLDPTDTATKISGRIGRSAGWVKSRLTLNHTRTVQPGRKTTPL